MYRELRGQNIIDTLERLRSRITARFPESGLSKVSGELQQFARASSGRIERLRRPHWPVRVAAVILVVVFVGILVAVGMTLRNGVSIKVEHVAELLQGLDAAVNEILLLTVALYFFFSLEGRLKRREALRALHELRSIAHVIDMHQLTKDPDATLSPEMATAVSPQRTMNRYELSRYLDYCSELLSLTSKLAALHVQYLPDPVVLEAVNDVESLADGLSQKIWQKVLVLEVVATGRLVEGAAGVGRGETLGHFAKGDGDAAAVPSHDGQPAAAGCDHSPNPEKA
jgi:hypothetical protein